MPETPSVDRPEPVARPPIGGPPRPRPLPGGLDAARTLERNAGPMLRSARRVSYCEDDAHDAVQAAAERFLKHRRDIDPETATGWLVTVARNEALRVRERRGRTNAIEEDDRRLVHTGDGPEDLASRHEDVALAREALGRLKPQERLALWLQAEGRSYDEIAAELEWTRTKVNRSISEGRASLRRTLQGIATGEGCAAAGPRIDRLAAGHASRDDLLALRPHLRRCSSCRGRLRRARGGRWGVLPPALLAWLPWAGRAGQAAPSPGRPRVAGVVAERLSTLLPATSGAATEAGLAVTAGVAAVALGAGVAAGGAAGDDPVEPRRGAPAVAHAAAPRGGVGGPGRVVVPAAAVGAAVTAGATASTRAVAAGADARARERRRAERRSAAARAERRRAATRRAERRRAERRRAEARRVAAAARSAGAPAARARASTGATVPTPAGPAPGSSGPPAGGGHAASSGSASAPRGAGSSAGDEFGFE